MININIPAVESTVSRIADTLFSIIKINGDLRTVSNSLLEQKGFDIEKQKTSLSDLLQNLSFSVENCDDVVSILPSVCELLNNTEMQAYRLLSDNIFVVENKESTDISNVSYAPNKYTIKTNLEDCKTYGDFAKAVASGNFEVIDVARYFLNKGYSAEQFTKFQNAYTKITGK